MTDKIPVPERILHLVFFFIAIPVFLWFCWKDKNEYIGFSWKDELKVWWQLSTKGYTD